MLSHSKPKHLSSSSPECPIRANVIAHIIMCEFGESGQISQLCLPRLLSDGATRMIQLHQSDWIMILMWVASASSFLSLPAIYLLLFIPPSLSLCQSAFSAPNCCQHFVYIFFQISNLCVRLQDVVQKQTILCLPRLKKQYVSTFALFY